MLATLPSVTSSRGSSPAGAGPQESDRDEVLCRCGGPIIHPSKTLQGSQVSPELRLAAGEDGVQRGAHVLLRRAAADRS